MATKETQELIIEALDYYINSLCPENERPSMDVMRKLIKLDDIKKGLEKKGNEE